jgi:myo-inositol-1(or 4)-monophosphatase
MSSLSSDHQWQALHGLVDQVAERQRADFGRIGSTLKPDGSLVTACDRWSDATFAAGLEQIYPDDGLLSEEGSTAVPQTSCCWVVDPLDGTTNFSVGLPIWAISLARFEDGRPLEAILDVPPLRQRYVAVRGQGVWRDGERLSPPGGPRHGCSCASLCTRSLPVIQQLPQRFPAKTRMLGVASLNLLGVGLGTMLAALEATPKIWDLAGVWLMLEELGCIIRPLADDPFPLLPGAPLGEASYPLLAACDEAEYQRFLPWGEALLKR